MFCLSSSPAGAIRDGSLLHVETDFGFGWLRRGLQQGAELLENLPQGHIVDQQRFIYLGQAPPRGKAETLKS